MTLSESKNQLQAQITMIQIVSSYGVSQSICAVAKLGIADLLKNGPKHCDELAEVTNCHSNSLYRILRALASLGIFAETEPRYFKLTPLADCLQDDAPNSVKAFAMLHVGCYYPVWQNLLYSVQTGNSAFEKLHGMSLSEYHNENPHVGEIFDRMMTEYSVIQKDAVLAAYDFSSINKLVDVGSGEGGLMAGILQKYPHLNGVLFDRSEVMETARHLFQEAKLTNRCEFIGGDFFASIPVENGDAYLLKNIIHDWDDRRSIAILQNCYQAMKSDAKLLVLEQVIAPGNERFFGKLMDINMLVMCPGGRERTEAEYRELFKSAGFELTNIVSTQSEISIIEAVPIIN